MNFRSPLFRRLPCTHKYYEVKRASLYKKIGVQGYPLISGNSPSEVSFKSVMQFLLSATLAESVNDPSPALTGAEITSPALAEPFKASGAAVAFWSFFAKEKGLGPRGYERANHH